MVNASLNWASIVGIVLAVGGALLYFMRSFKPALARDYDVFFAAVGLLCGGILFFQGWRLDPILQFGQFLLAGTTVFFAYESVRLRGVTTEQARRSSYFDDDEPLPPPAGGPYRPRMGAGGWRDGEADRFDEPQPLRRRIGSRDEEAEADDFYRPRRSSSRAAIPERAASRRPSEDDWGSEGRGRESAPERDSYGGNSRRYSADRSSAPQDFGARRRERESLGDSRRGSRPVAAAEGMPRSSRRPAGPAGGGAPTAAATTGTANAGIPQGSPLRSSRRDADVSDADFTPLSGRGGARADSNRPADAGSGEPGSASAQAGGRPAPSARRDNSSRFDD